MSSGAVFTIRLKDLLIATGGEWDSSSGISVISGGDLGLDKYPLFTDGKSREGEDAIPDYRPILNGKIFDHFMNQEIAYESIGLWHLAIRRRMNEIMPFYNQYYLSTQINIEPIRTTDLSTTNTVNDVQVINQESDTTSNSNAQAVARSVSSDTPQTMLSGNEDYASAATDSNSNNNTTGVGNQVTNGTTTDNVNANTTITGYQGAASSLLMQWRDSFVNVDMMVINELNDLFMGILDNGDSFTNNSTYGGYLLW